MAITSLTSCNATNKFPYSEGQSTHKDATYSSEGRSFFVKSLTCAKNALIPKRETQFVKNQPPRIKLHERLVSTIDSSQREPKSFVRALMGVNLNLDTHNDSNLTQLQADNYASISSKVQNGELSNTSAHLQAARSWVKIGGHSGVVGALMNVSGALVSGVIDHAEYKLGKA